MRLLFILFIAILISFLVLQGRVQQRNDVYPIFLITDSIAKRHETSISISIQSVYKPTEAACNMLTIDYSDIWAHLNHLYETNDVEKGKEYYTEDWFKQICTHYKYVQAPIVRRNDLQHKLNIINWENDGLLCTAIDSNVLFRYYYPDKSQKNTLANIAVILLLQGDHWRIDAIKILNETEIIDKPL